jgi:protein-S-isoprenylcysteine O-methyltransferase Ste14
MMRRLLAIPVPWVFVLVYLIGVFLERVAPLPVRLSPLPAISIVGAVVFAVGAALALWGLITFHRARTTTVPGQRSSTLVTWGPYRFSRNPMYVGLAIAYLGEAALLHHVWPVVLLPVILAYLNWTVIPVEEGKLQDVFGSTYDQYRASVNRWL